MTFTGLEGIPCQCVKIVQKGDGYKVSIYKEQLSGKDAGTWDLKISMKDDKTQAFVKPTLYDQTIKINFVESKV